jgi:ferric-dicitrate binding protein FerR (iron transport regulator)
MKPGRLRPSVVEPLSRQAWERVETRLFERLGRGEHLPSANVSVRGPAPVRVWLGAAALVLTGTVLLWLVLDTIHHTDAVHHTGTAHHAAAPAPLTPAPGVAGHIVEPAPAAAHAPAPRVASEITRIVTTSAETRTTLGEAALTLAADSDVTVRGNDSEGWLIELERGEVECEVAPRRGRAAFVVQAGETRVSVVGTRFSVSRDSDSDSASVSVREGQVRVESGKLVALLGPGDRWPRAGTEPREERSARAPRSGTEAARTRFERAARLEASEPEKALRIYAELARARGPWAANALYAQARLESERGRRARARALLQRYLARFPKGVNREDVRALLEQE